jgi:hypothetical protein
MRRGACLLVCFLSLIALTYSGRSLFRYLGVTPTINSDVRINPGFENPETQIHLLTMHRGGSSTPMWELEINQGQRSDRLTSLSQLQNQVHIENANAALRFVRLKTDYSRCWGNQLEYEIHSIPVSNTKPQQETSGVDGALNHDVFEVGKFSRATVEYVAHTYIVNRWIFVTDPSAKMETILKIQEYVGANGEYKRIVLQEEAPPELPRTTWGITLLR